MRHPFDEKALLGVRKNAHPVVNISYLLAVCVRHHGTLYVSGVRAWTPKINSPDRRPLQAASLGGRQSN